MMLMQVAHATPLPHQPDIALPLRGKRADASSGLCALGIAMSFGRNMEIYAEGEPAGHVYKVVSGVVRISKLLPDGRRQISAFHTPGNMFGFEAYNLHHSSAEAVVPAKVIAYKWQSLLSAGTRSTSLARDLLNLTMVGLRDIQEHLLLLGRKNALERVAAFLLDMAKRTKAGSVVELAMPRHDIADHLGLTLETVSRMFAKLRERGVIKLEGARRIHLLDLERLAAMCR
jgi:CRP/FNR family nitrogen fixation transcriptional regulator